jgi:hypothetical protein
VGTWLLLYGDLTAPRKRDNRPSFRGRRVRPEEGRAHLCPPSCYLVGLSQTCLWQNH